MPTPTIGRTVIYTNAKGEQLPAVVVKVQESGKVNLQVFLNQSCPNLAHVTDVEQVEEPEAGKFHFPVIVAPVASEDRNQNIAAPEVIKNRAAYEKSAKWAK